MTTLPANEFPAYDFALDGKGYLTEPFDAESAFSLDAPDLALEQQDFSEELSENKLDSLQWGAQRSQHMGAGQKRLDMPNASDPYKFLSSQGIDISEPGEVTLLKEVTRRLTLTNTNQHMVATDTTVFVVSGTGTMKRFTAVDASDAVNVTGLPAISISDLATDGTDCYVALSTGGSSTYKVTPGGTVSAVDTTFDNAVLTWAKDRFYCAGIKTGTQWRFFSLLTTGSPTELFVLPDGWSVTSIAELGPLVYFTAHKGNRSVIYAYDGVNAPFIALPEEAIGLGTVALNLIPFAGAGFLVGCQRITSAFGVGPGFVFRCFPISSGHLTNFEQVVEIGTDDGLSYAPLGGFAHGKYAYFSWREANAAGIGVYNPETGAYAKHVASTVSPNVVRDAAMFKGRRVFTVDGDGLWIEDIFAVASGHLISSKIDLNMFSDKLWLAQETTFTIPAGGSVKHEYSIDEGVTWVTPTGGTATSGTRNRSSLGSAGSPVKSPGIQYRLTLTRGTTPTTAPKVFSTGVGGWPAVKPKGTHVLIVRAYPDLEDRNGETRHRENGGWAILNDLITLRDAHGIVEYQPPYWPLSGVVKNVRVAGVRLLGPWGLSGREQGGLIQLTLKELP